jgi:hypothetical protein
MATSAQPASSTPMMKKRLAMKSAITTVTRMR